MGALKKKQIITEQALEAPLELGNNFALADVEVNKLLESLAKLATAGKKVDTNLDLAKSTKEVSDETKDLVVAQQELAKIDKQIATAQSRQNKESIEKQKQLKQIRGETKRLVNEQNKLLGEEEKLIKANKELLQQRRGLVKADSNYADQVADLNKQIDANNKAIRANGSQVEEQRAQIGGYREALEGLGVNLQGVTDKAGGIGVFFKTFSGGMGEATKASLRFIATPVGAVLAAIVAAIALLTLAVTNNQGAADDFNKIWGGITEVLSEVFSRIVRLGTALSRFVQGDFAGAAEAASMAFDDLAGSLARAFVAGRELVQMQIDLEKATIAATTATKTLEGEIELLDITVGNATKSFAEREAAAVSARVKEAELAKINLDLAQQEADIINKNTALLIKKGTVQRTDLQLQADALAKVIEVSNTALAIEAQNQLEIDQLKQDRLEKDLDILIDGFDNVKTINERIINSDKTTIRNRQEGLDELVKLGDDSFNAQVATIRQFTKIAFDENELLKEQDAVVLNQRIRNLGLSEIIEGRLLEVIRERRIVLADTAEIEEVLQEASIARLQQIADNEKNITDDRIAALLEIGEIRNKNAEMQLKQGVANEQEFKDEVLKIQNELADQIAQLQLQRFDEEFTDAQLDSETDKINRLIDLNEQFRTGEIETVEEFERRKLEIQADAQRESLNAQLDFLEERKGLLEGAGVDVSEIDRNIAAVRLELSQATNEQIIENEGKLQEALNELKEAAVESSLSLIDTFNEVEDEKREQRLEVIDQEEADALEAAGDNLEKQEEVKIEFAKRREAVEAEQAKADRKKAIFEKALAATSIGVDTAVAIVKALRLPPPLSFTIAGIVAAIGAVQLAAVLAKPIPAFMKGTDSAPGGLKMINEQSGGEAWVTPSGELRYAGNTGAMIVGDDIIPQGSKIFTASETAKMMGNPIEFNGISGGVAYTPRDRDSQSSSLMRALLRQGKSTENAIKNKKEYHVRISKHATDKLTKSGENWNKILNEYL